MPAKKGSYKRKSTSKKSTSSVGSMADRLFLFYGSDEAKVKESALKLSQVIAPQDNEFGLEIINGTAENSEHARRILSSTGEAIQTMPFFGNEKVVWLQGVNFFTDNQTGKAESTLRALEVFLDLLKAGIPDNVKVIISSAEMDRRRALYKGITKLAKVENFDMVDTNEDGWEAVVLVGASKMAYARQMQFDPGALERFIMLVGADTRTLENELEKLSLFFGTETVITEEHVSEMVTANHAGIVFEIGDAITRKNLPKALELIDGQLRKGENPVGIIRKAIIPKIRSMLHAKGLISKHRLNVGGSYPTFLSQLNALPASETAHLARTKEGKLSVYPMYMSAKTISKFTLAELFNALEACLEADLRLVTSSLDARLVLSQLVARILA